MEISSGVSIFYSYSHKDERFCETLRAHLSVLERKEVISSWYDRKIKPGQLWQREIDTNIKRADIIVLLVSADFVASDYCYQEELQIAMERHEANQAIVVPVVVRPVDFSETPFSKIQALPKDAYPITKWNDEDEAWINVVEGIKSAINEVRFLKKRGGSDEGFRSINHYLVRELDSLEGAFEADGSNATNRGLSTGLFDLDRVTDGLHKSDFIAIAGRPGMGKTDLALKIACNAVIAEKKSVGYFSLNLPVDRLMRKMLSALGRLPVHKLFRGDLEEDDWPRLTSAVSLLKDLPLYIDDNISLSIDELRNRAIKTKEDKNVELIIVDSLQHMDFNSEHATPESISKVISRLARELKIPIIATTTISRDVEGRPNKRPLTRDLGAWRCLEEDADTMIFVYRDEVYNEDSVDNGVTELIVAKNSSASSIGTVKVFYTPGTCSFDNFLDD
ncbi:TIR domain-containing protein [Marinobacter sp. 71-i]|uniref:TIR domain-containing protein n=1 Tax=Marinobacter iranensis TaxID=2962607 RepID=A0ABT5YG36_9GAMM|nr:DnaB-like helicase C-terminal domain-containing protein [Marinobacter iranensis]MDF0752660.1 TIR domain-containing protein [Marinobacter iranensis]